MMGPVKAIPGKFSCWDKHHVNGPKTLGDMVTFYKEKHNCELSMIAAGSIMLYNSYDPKNKERLDKDPITVYE